MQPDAAFFLGVKSFLAFGRAADGYYDEPGIV